MFRLYTEQGNPKYENLKILILLCTQYFRNPTILYSLWLHKPTIHTIRPRQIIFHVMDVKWSQLLPGQWHTKKLIKPFNFYALIDFLDVEHLVGKSFKKWSNNCMIGLDEPELWHLQTELSKNLKSLSLKVKWAFSFLMHKTQHFQKWELRGWMFLYKMQIPVCQ